MWIFLVICVLSWLTFIFVRQRWESDVIGELWRRPILVTGCDTGFGHDSALRLAKMGVPVYAGCLTEEGMTKLQTKASKIPSVKLTPIQLDVTSDESVDKMGAFLEKECQQYGGLWAVINNAGVGLNVFLDDFLSPDDYRSTFEVNLYGIIRVVHRVRRLIKQKKGRIVNVTSAFGRCPTPCIGPYLVSKYAATAYTDAIGKELSPWGIEVLTVEPGFVKTPLTNTDRIRKGNEKLWDRASDELKADYGLEFFNKTCDNQAMMMNGFGSNTTEKVTDAYVKAVTSLYTRRRYKVGWDTAFVWHPLSMMPTNLQDWAFYVMDLISRGPLPARVIAERQGKC